MFRRAAIRNSGATERKALLGNAWPEIIISSVKYAVGAVKILARDITRTIAPHL